MLIVGPGASQAGPGARAVLPRVSDAAHGLQRALPYDCGTALFYASKRKVWGRVEH